jgi:glycosyltransferase involved in cell wall biosynthesis
VQTAYLKGLPKIEEQDGFTVYRIPSLRRRVDTCSIWEMAIFLVTNSFPALWQSLTWKPDLIHAHFAVPTGVIGFLVSMLTRIPYVLTVHLGDVPGGVPDQTDRLFKLIQPLTVPIWKRAGAIIAVSDHVRQLALRSYAVPIQTIHNGIDLQTCTPSSPTPHQPVRLIFVGRFNPQKNLLFFIDILSEVADLNWEMEWVGDGSLRTAIQAKIDGLALTSRCRLHGWLNRDQVEYLMSSSDVLVLPSLAEGLPVVGIKALGCGLAILGSRIGGMTDIVEDGKNGYLCSVNDAEAFVEALRSLLSVPERLQAMKKASIQIAQKFDLRTIAAQYEQSFQAVIA